MLLILWWSTQKHIIISQNKMGYTGHAEWLVCARLRYVAGTQEGQQEVHEYDAFGGGYIIVQFQIL